MSARNKAPNFGAAIERLRSIAMQSGDALLTEGPVHPDHKLLDLCAEAAQLREEAAETHRVSHREWKVAWGDAAQAVQNQKHSDNCRYADRRLVTKLRAIAKISATTPAGIYAKAVAVRASKTGAATLAMSLADDLIACPGLRASLWPAEASALAEGD